MSLNNRITKSDIVRKQYLLQFARNNISTTVMAKDFPISTLPTECPTSEFLTRGTETHFSLLSVQLKVRIYETPAYSRG